MLDLNERLGFDSGMQGLISPEDGGAGGGDGLPLATNPIPGAQPFMSNILRKLARPDFNSGGSASRNKAVQANTNAIESSILGYQRVKEPKKSDVPVAKGLVDGQQVQN